MTDSTKWVITKCERHHSGRYWPIQIKEYEDMHTLQPKKQRNRKIKYSKKFNCLG
jgi:hypothetical protein